jgi:PAS domain-containing protein
MYESERESTSSSDSADASAFLESLQADAPIAVGFVDRSFRYVFVNEALANINRRSVPEHIGRTVADKSTTKRMED